MFLSKSSWKSFFWGGLAPLLISSLGSSAEMPIVGKDGDNNEFHHMVESSLYNKKLSLVVNEVTSSTMDAIHSNESHLAESNGRWDLRDVCVILAVNFNAGLGPLLGITATSALRLTFSNSKKPELP